MNADVVVIGAGIIGAACARALARAGMSVVIVDRAAPASATSARGEGNLLVSDKAPGPELDLALLASAHWPVLAAELADELGTNQTGASRVSMRHNASAVASADLGAGQATPASRTSGPITRSSAGAADLRSADPGAGRPAADGRTTGAITRSSSGSADLRSVDTGASQTDPAGRTSGAITRSTAAPADFQSGAETGAGQADPAGRTSGAITRSTAAPADFQSGAETGAGQADPAGRTSGAITRSTAAPADLRSGAETGAGQTAPASPTPAGITPSRSGTASPAATVVAAGFPDIEYDRKGGIVVATTEAGAEPLRAFARSQAAVGVEVEHLSPAEALSLEPHLNPAITAAVHYPQDAQLQPVVATEALLASARLAGVRILSGQEVVGLERAGDRITGVRTSSGTIGTDTVVVAAGPWSGAVADALGADLPVRPRRGMVLVTSRMPQRVFHKVYDGDYFGATQSADADLQTSSVVESTPGGTVLIGSSRQQIGFDDRLRVEVLAQVAQRALRLFPFLEGTPVIRAYGGFRPYMPDHLPVIGEDHRRPGLWYATGHEGAGIGLAGVTGDLLCAQLTGAEPALDPAPFLPSRPTLAAHLKPETAPTGTALAETRPTESTPIDTAPTDTALKGGTA
ncbi:Glycine/D-amino acid oxidase [Glycomyces sambucus]|uniref:Glycine/D-amino acid oxidase n=1 Tax=Glycomyces sambucus TaxID=380244 RepID=A0A1G9I0L5_9ACTN|nr:FAD-dependent oxidoreductase [Glycomyces sambucus]SDL18363.1 Glycine/D-amino acid oxidase [Glycomyces sambucus]